MTEKLLFTPQFPKQESFEDIILQSAPQGTAFWKSARTGRFTSSLIGKLFVEPRSKAEAEANFGFGATACDYIKEVALEMYTGNDISADLSDQTAIKYGRILEEPAARLYELITGDTTTQMGFASHGDSAGGSPDRLSRTRGLLEIKNPYNRNVYANYLMNIKDGASLKKAVPLYWHQIESLLYFLKLPVGHFLAFDFRYFSNGYTHDWEGISPEYCFENSTERERKLAMHMVEIEPLPEYGELLEATLERAVKLRDRYYAELVERFGEPEKH